jgi:hypothetical protein
MSNGWLPTNISDFRKYGSPKGYNDDYQEVDIISVD